MNRNPTTQCCTDYENKLSRQCGEYRPGKIHCDEHMNRRCYMHQDLICKEYQRHYQNPRRLPSANPQFEAHPLIEAKYLAGAWNPVSYNSPGYVWPF